VRAFIALADHLAKDREDLVFATTLDVVAGPGGDVAILDRRRYQPKRGCPVCILRLDCVLQVT
jgi:hypothetical protein